MDNDYAPWIALASGIVGMLIGYIMGYRTGRIAGELEALKSTRVRKHSRRGARHSLDRERESELEDADRMELSS